VKRIILLIEDDKVDQLAFERLVKAETLPYDYIIVESVSEAKKILNDQTVRFDVILVDNHLGDGTAFDICDSFNVIDPPVIFVTGTGDQETAVKALKSGAYDYLIKDTAQNYLKVLAVTIENAIKCRNEHP